MSLNTIMTALADKVRRLSGRDSKMSVPDMTADIDDANTEIAVQSDLITQIRAALVGKAVSNGGGSAIYTGTVELTDEDATELVITSDADIGDNDIVIARRIGSFNFSDGGVSFPNPDEVISYMSYDAGTAESMILYGSGYKDSTGVTVFIGGYTSSSTEARINGKAIAFGDNGRKDGSWEWIHIKR